MKSERILDALGHVDESLLVLCEQYVPSRHHPWRWVSAAACVAVAALSAVFALHGNFSADTPKPAASETAQETYSEASLPADTEAPTDAELPQIHLPAYTAPATTESKCGVTDTPAADATQKSAQETAAVPDFDRATRSSTKYPALLLNGQNYTSRGLSKPILGAQLKTKATLTGFDGIHTTEVELYTIQDIALDAAVAVRFPETGEVYAYVNTDYKPATLGQLWDDLNLSEYLTFGKVYFEATTYADPPKSEIEKLLDPDAPLRAGDTSPKNDVMHIHIDVPVLGYTNHAFSLTSDGYLHTNLLESGKYFYIGKARVDAFLQYVYKNCAAVSYTPTTNAGGTTVVMTSAPALPIAAPPQSAGTEKNTTIPE
ncbi:MAG: hypothetical protein ACI4I5_10445 [Acutalibacteraceae bacterium]